MNSENNTTVAAPSVVAPTVNAPVPPQAGAVPQATPPKPRPQRSGKKSANASTTVTPQIKR